MSVSWVKDKYLTADNKRHLFSSFLAGVPTDEAG